MGRQSSKPPTCEGSRTGTPWSPYMFRTGSEHAPVFHARTFDATHSTATHVILSDTRGPRIAAGKTQRKTPEASDRTVLMGRACGHLIARCKRTRWKPCHSRTEVRTNQPKLGRIGQQHCCASAWALRQTDSRIKPERDDIDMSAIYTCVRGGSSGDRGPSGWVLRIRAWRSQAPD